VTLVGGLLGTAFSGVFRVTAAGADSIQDADVTVQSLRRAADDAASTYFAALEQSQTIQRQIDQLEAQLPGLVAQLQSLRIEVQRRAAVAYVGRGSHQLSALLSSNALDAARRAKWLDALNARDDASLRDLTKLETQLDDQRTQLRHAQVTQQAAIVEIQAKSTEINAKLQSAIDRLRSLQAVVVSRPVVPGGTGPGTSPGAPAPAAPIDYHPTPGVHPHHDDPFLACTRGIESGGNYAAYNPAGPYLGAYQFLQSTWNSTANHAGRTELIGVPANTASQYDQDDIAWALYQWQGAGPWGSRCD
jgi:peptidoglycan hydrolase CwlO-like protein